MSDNMSVIVRKRGKRINHEPFCYDFCKKCEKRKVIDKNHETCQLCYKIFKPNLSGNIVIDEIIRNTRVNFVKGSNHRILEFVPYNQFKNIEFIAEGGFSKIYKAIWVDGPINTFYYDTDNIVREYYYTVVLKKLNNSKNITSKELNEFKVYYQILSNNDSIINNNISRYFGITKDPFTKDMMIIMPYYCLGRRPFGDEIHDIELIIKICDGLRPPIVTNAPEGYIELMKECWHSDPAKRPTAEDIYWKINKMRNNESYINQTKIIESSDIGPVTINNPDAIYKSRPLSRMIQSAMSLRNSRSQTIDPFYYYQKNADKRKFEDDSVEDSNDNEQSIKRRKFLENENSDYFTKEIELDINMSSNQSHDKGYVTKEIELDINAL
ncbi:uncharacterized protein OCT59_004904 [Rhizophagus irregularis]|uniref:uncharacterized protein n=1 Tax=Rhizophagus irregularis TaxID=588596 RepID=UPI003317E87D|nr:hypothetical protein OCT59_004904 [Rhizophagus irregularis]